MCMRIGLAWLGLSSSFGLADAKVSLIAFSPIPTPSLATPLQGVAFELNKLGSVCSLGGGEDGEDGAGDKASQEDIVRSAVQRMIKEREDATFSDEEEDLLDD